MYVPFVVFLEAKGSRRKALDTQGTYPLPTINARSVLSSKFGGGGLRKHKGDRDNL
jgi:hypothetical protein